MRVKGEIVYRFMLKSQSFSDPVTMGYDLHKCFSVFIFRSLFREPEVGYFPSPMLELELGTFLTLFN